MKITIAFLLFALAGTQLGSAFPYKSKHSIHGTIDGSGVFWPYTGQEDFYVCVEFLNVYGGAREDAPLMATLPYGTPVRIHERGQWVVGWAMIDSARWVVEINLCPLL